MYQNRGVYTLFDGSIRAVATLATMGIGTGRTIQGFGSPQLFDRSVVFYDDVDLVIYTDVNGTLERLIGPGDVIDGRTIRGVYMGPNSRSGNDLAFLAVSTSATEATSDIYIAHIPAPATLAPLALAGLLATRRARRAGTGRA
ncbi:MAG: hypothetical protein JNM07_13720 [Phycisphaerae bacterium]|nr:hypothetical protein [Phycisphaerae bacterium]